MVHFVKCIVHLIVRLFKTEQMHTPTHTHTSTSSNCWCNLPQKKIETNYVYKCSTAIILVYKNTSPTLAGLQ